jgi:hypothetical protein
LILPLSAESSDGMMLRGGFPLDAKADLNYAVYGSAISTVHNNLESDRNFGGRVGVFLPGSRLELGTSGKSCCRIRVPIPSDFTLPGSPRGFRSTCTASTRGRIRAADIGSMAHTV